MLCYVLLEDCSKLSSVVFYLLYMYVCMYSFIYYCQYRSNITEQITKKWRIHIEHLTANIKLRLKNTDK